MELFERSTIELTYDFSIEAIIPIQSGLINTTAKLVTNKGEYILQRMNTEVFKNADLIAENIEALGSYLQRTDPSYPFVRIVRTSANGLYCSTENGLYRVFPFVVRSHTISAIDHEDQAFGAARAFARFTSKLSGFSLEQLKTTIPNFHNLTLRFAAFKKAVSAQLSQRSTKASTLIGEFLAYSTIVSDYERFIAHPLAKQRVMHHDTKISNVLFDEANKGICVIDLDTVMPGYLFSDVGDMMRTYLSAANEEEQDLDRILIRKPILERILRAYTTELGTEINSFELDNFYLFGRILIYMQGLRFLTDYLENDWYYGKQYEDHNLNRAANQLRLLQVFIEATR